MGRGRGDAPGPAANPHGTVQAGVHAVLLDAAMNFADQRGPARRGPHRRDHRDLHRAGAPGQRGRPLPAARRGGAPDPPHRPRRGHPRDRDGDLVSRASATFLVHRAHVAPSDAASRESVALNDTGPGCRPVRDARPWRLRGPRGSMVSRRRTSLAVVVVVLMSVVLTASSSRAAPGDLSFVACVGDLSGCASTTPAGVLGGAESVAVAPTAPSCTWRATRHGPGAQLLRRGPGRRNVRGCVGMNAGCAPTSRPRRSTACAPSRSARTATTSTRRVTRARTSAGSRWTRRGPDLRRCLGEASGARRRRP